jgi:predicted Zn-dependent protease with MMP-like domain
VTSGFGACAIRSPDEAACASPATLGSKSPAKAADMATVTIRFIEVHPRQISNRTVSDWTAKVNSQNQYAPEHNTRYKYVLMWTEAKAPSLAEMEAMAHEVFERLPKTFRTLCQGVIIRVEDFPTDEVLDEMQAQTEFDLLGLFQGIGLPQQSNDDVARLPNMIWLYRRPILDYWAEHEETLGHIVRHVLIHEIGHHFGLSDADMEAIEASAG